MITKAQLKKLKDSNNHVKLEFDIPWNETSLARLYDKLDAQLEGGCLADIVSVEPLSFNNETQSIRVEIVIDISDMLEETEED
jgi:hypothetical protein